MSATYIHTHIMAHTRMWIFHKHYMNIKCKSRNKLMSRTTCSPVKNHMLLFVHMFCLFLSDRTDAHAAEFPSEVPSQLPSLTPRPQHVTNNTI